MKYRATNFSMNSLLSSRTHASAQPATRDAAAQHMQHSLGAGEGAVGQQKDKAHLEIVHLLLRHPLHQLVQSGAFDCRALQSQLRTIAECPMTILTCRTGLTDHRSTRTAASSIAYLVSVLGVRVHYVVGGILDTVTLIE